MDTALFQLPAIGPISAFLAMQLKQSILSVTSQVLLCFLTPPTFLQNHFFITSLHLCTVNKSSGLYLTDLKVNSNQVKCSPSWWKTVWLSWTDNWTDFNFAIISLSRGKKTNNNKKNPLLQENSRRGIFTVMWSHPACSSQPEDKNKLRGEYYEQQNKSGINRRYHSLICNT